MRLSFHGQKTEFGDTRKKQDSILRVDEKYWQLCRETYIEKTGGYGRKNIRKNMKNGVLKRIRTIQISIWMKAVAGMFILLLTLDGCSPKANMDDMMNGTEADDVGNAMEGTTIPFEQEFYEIMADNPIDRELTWEDTGSVDRIDFACEYRDAWMAEIDHTLIVLEKYLSEEDYESVRGSYEGWNQYIRNMMSVEQSLFYPGSNYVQEDTNIITGDGNTYPRVMEVMAARTKDYAVELMSLEYALTGKVEFIFGVSQE